MHKTEPDNELSYLYSSVRFMKSNRRLHKKVVNSAVNLGDRFRLFGNQRNQNSGEQ
jgi:hypothetical protein